MMISSPVINAATVVEDAILMTAVISTLRQMEILRKKKKLQNAPMTIPLGMFMVILAAPGMITTQLIVECLIPTLSILLSCAALVEVVAKEVRLALNSNLLMNGQKNQMSVRTTTLFMIHMVTHAQVTMTTIQVSAVSGIPTHLTLLKLAASALVETSTMMVSAKTMIQLLIVMVTHAQVTMTTIQLSAEPGIPPISTLMNNAALAPEEAVESVLMTSHPLTPMEILANTTNLILLIADFTMTMTSTPWNSVALVKQELLLVSMI